jgi:hypothetical protein
MIAAAAFAALLLAQAPSQVAPPSQAPAAVQQTRLRVFLDCDCFQDYIRSELTFVDYVRQRESADVHVLGQSRETGGSGREYALRFIGLGTLAGFDLDLRAVTTASDTEDTRRRAVRSTLTAGFLTYISRAGLPNTLRINVEQPAAATPAAGRDRWNFWVYSVRASAELEAEESQREWNWDISGSADRVTAAWKLSIGFGLEQSVERFDLDEDNPFESRRHNRRLGGVAVKSLGEHWSAGMLGEVSSSSFENRSLIAGIAPAVEYNVFPYSQYTRRQLRMLYFAGPLHSRYYEVTLFDKLRETRLLHALYATFDQREPWGTLQARMELEQFLPDTHLYNLEFNGEMNIRVIRGLSFSIRGGASRIRDQIYLPKRGASSEEVLLRLRRLQSGYEYNLDVGFTYTFGSIFNNVVNPRFGM